MTNKELIQKIRQEVERLKECTQKTSRDLHDFSAYMKGEMNAYEDVETTLDSILETLPEEPQGLDEAAEHYLSDKNVGELYADFTKDTFKAGAVWMANQGVSWEDEMTYYDGFLIYGKDERAYTMEGTFEAGDKVIVQIRKR